MLETRVHSLLAKIFLYQSIFFSASNHQVLVLVSALGSLSLDLRHETLIFILNKCVVLNPSLAKNFGYYGVHLQLN